MAPAPLAPAEAGTDLLGRDAELRQARAAVDAAVGERALRVVLVRGVEGSGKSRLVEALLGGLDEAMRARASRVPFAPGEPLPAWGLDRLLRRALELPEGLEEEPLREALAAALSPLEQLAGEDAGVLRFEFLAFVLGAASPGFRTARMDVRSRWEGAFAELKRVLEQRAARTPWVCVLEDADRGDVQTADFLDWALGLRWEAPVVLVATLRGEEPEDNPWLQRVERWRRAAAVVDVPLAPLPAVAMAALVRQVGGGALSPQRVDALVEHARGNPLFARELVLLLRARPEAAGAGLPTGLLDAMAAQLALLPTDALEVLRRAACIGPRASHEALVQLWGGAPDALTRAVDVLVARGLLALEPSLLVPGTVDLVFCRGMLHGAALSHASEAERRAWLEQLEVWARARLLAEAAGWGGAEVQLAGLVVRALAGRGAHAEASLWQELVGRVHLKHQRRTEALRALRAAAEHATGVRRSVLVRLIGEGEVMAGEVQRALATFAARPQLLGTAAPAADGALVARVVALLEDPLERWDVLSVEEAGLALELARAEALSHIGKSEETRTAFTTVEERLKRLQGGAAPHLWTRWARTWSWFLAELLGRPRDALRVCEQVRARADVKASGLDASSEALLRAEQVAASRTGDLERARALADAQLELARRRGSLADEAVCWNARAILHMSVGELAAAYRGFRTSAELSRSIGFKRREAIALHNLGIALLEQGEPAGARDAQLQYLSLSKAIGNRPALAYGPASLAAVALAARDWEEVDRRLAEARHAAEENGWPFILAWARGLNGRARLMRWAEGRDALLLKQAKGDLLACLDAVEERGSAWTEELDPGEYYLAYALVALGLGTPAAARDALGQGRRMVARSCVVSHAWLEVGEALVEGRREGPALSWFAERGYARAARFIEEMRHALGVE